MWSCIELFCFCDKLLQINRHWRCFMKFKSTVLFAVLSLFSGYLYSSVYEFNIPLEMSSSIENTEGKEKEKIAWRDFFVSTSEKFNAAINNGTLSYQDGVYAEAIGMSTKEEWESGNWYVMATKVGITDSSRPQEKIGLKYINSFSMADNKMTNVDFLEGLVSTGRSLDIRENQISSLAGLSSLESVGDSLILSGNKLSSLNHLQKLKKAQTIKIDENPYLTDLSGIENVDGVGLLVIDNPSRYRIRPKYGAKLCDRIVARRTTVMEHQKTSNGGDSYMWVNYNAICGY